jgi:hypothetical protein
LFSKLSQLADFGQEFQDRFVVSDQLSALARKFEREFVNATRLPASGSHVR